MAYYDPLIAKWATLTPGTTAHKLTEINAATVAGPAQKTLLAPSDVLNAIVPADLAALTPAQVSQLTLMLQGAVIDASVGTTIRAAALAMFAGKAQTLNNLSALVAPFDAPTSVLWWASVGYPCPIRDTDLAAAGLS